MNEVKLVENVVIPKINQRLVYFSLSLAMFSLLISIIYFFIAQPELPIFYTLANKSDQLVPKYFIFIFPLISLLITIIHTPIASILYRKSIVILKIFMGTTLLFQVLLALALLRIIIITI